MNRKGMALVEIVIVVAVLGSISFFGIGLWTDRTLDFWLTHFKGQEVNVPFILSGILSVVLNVMAIAINVISEILRIFVA